MDSKEPIDPQEPEIRELADEIYRDKVRRARGLSPSSKMGLGAEIFAEVCGRMRSGIRHQFPQASDKEVNTLLRQRLDRLAKIREAGMPAETVGA